MYIIFWVKIIIRLKSLKDLARFISLIFCWSVSSWLWERYPKTVSINIPKCSKIMLWTNQKRVVNEIVRNEARHFVIEAFMPSSSAFIPKSILMQIEWFTLQAFQKCHFQTLPSDDYCSLFSVKFYREYILISFHLIPLHTHCPDLTQCLIV